MNLPAIIMMSIIIIVFLIADIIIFALALKKIYKYKNYAKTIGTCVDYREYFDSYNFVWRMRPLIIYKVYNTEYEVWSENGYTKTLFPLKGRKFKVKYDPNSPNNAIVTDTINLFLIVATGFLIGIIIMIIISFINLFPDLLSKNYEALEKRYVVFCTVNNYTYNEIVYAESEEKAKEKLSSKLDKMNCTITSIIQEN